MKFRLSRPVCALLTALGVLFEFGTSAQASPELYKRTTNFMWSVLSDFECSSSKESLVVPKYAKSKRKDFHLVSFKKFNGDKCKPLKDLYLLWNHPLSPGLNLMMLQVDTSCETYYLKLKVRKKSQIFEIESLRCTKNVDHTKPPDGVKRHLPAIQFPRPRQ